MARNVGDRTGFSICFVVALRLRVISGGLKGVIRMLRPTDISF